MKLAFSVLSALLLLFVADIARANNCPSYPNNLTNGTTADATQVMGNFSTIMNCASFFVGGTTAGSAGTQTLATVSPGVFSLTSGNRVTFIAGFSSTGATTLNIASTGAINVLKKTASGLAALGSGDMFASQVYTVQYDGTQYELLDPVSSGGGGTGASQPQGRLTLQSNTPVQTSDQTAKSTLYYDCYNAGNQVPYYTGATDALDTIASCQASTALQASGTGVLNSSGVFDVWWVHSGANRLCIATNGSGGGWASDTGGSNTSRGTGYSQLNTTSRAYITNQNALTHCYNGSTDYGSVSANQATYLGSIYTTAAGQTGVALLPAAASGGSNTIVGVFNAYNRVPVQATSRDSTTSWTYNSGSSTWRPANNQPGNRISWVDGLQVVNVRAIYGVAEYLYACGSISTPTVAGIDFNSTSAVPGGQIVGDSDCGDSGSGAPGAHEAQALASTYPLSGFNYAQAVENTAGSVSVGVTFYGAGLQMLSLFMEM